MDLSRAFSCDDANVQVIGGLLVGAFVGELVYVSGGSGRWPAWSSPGSAVA
jgi:hypothetical protein